MTGWTIPHAGEVQAVVAASPEDVYAVVADVTRIAEWSHECRAAEWLDAATGPALGARFRGSNKVDRFGWSRVCTITELEPGRRFGYRTSGGVPSDSTRWAFDLKPTDSGGTRLRLRFRILRMSRPVELAIVAFMPQHRDRREALGEDLVRLGQVASHTVSAGP